jgi:hypothetical protein
MKKSLSKKTILKEAGVLLIASLMVLSAIVVTANTSNKGGRSIVVDEGFEAGVMPPVGWTVNDPSDNWGITTEDSYLINKDVKQVFPSSQDNFEIVLEGDWSKIPVGPSDVINPFPWGWVQVSYDNGTGQTTVHFSGAGIDQGPEYKHFGFGSGLPQNNGLIVSAYWSKGGDKSYVPDGSFYFSYDSSSYLVMVDVINAMEEPTIIADVGYLIFPEEQPLAHMNREIMPPEMFIPSGIDDGTVLHPGEAVSFEIPDVAPTDWIITFQSVWFAESPLGGYEEDVGDWVQVSALEITPTPDLDCEGSLSWTKVKPGSTVTGSFKVKNIGEDGSLLNWDITSYPTWGTWTFTPDGGTGLPDGESTTVAVTVVAPPGINTEYTGKVKIINSDDPTDFCEINVVLKTPRVRSNTFVLNLLDRFPNAFLILRYLMGL